ncbi:flagellar protein FlgN [Ostreiculturibacter nitratireducens]|uniref:flagellar protein FlgN n=1 Tax=Ostreiculturibacter nitratireducens TaxID=3075226 RepID=UPI0031B58BB0
MPRNEVSGVISALEEMLDAERHAIRNAEFDGLGKLAARQAELLDRLVASVESPDATALLRLKARADANQRLLSAALKGVQAAKRRLEMIRAASRSINSYDGRGRAQTISCGNSTVERRA